MKDCPSKKIRILYQIHPRIIGGMETFLFDLLKHLDHEIFEPVLCSWGSGEYINLFRPLKIETIIINTQLHDKLDKLAGVFKEKKISLVQTNTCNAELAMAAKTNGLPHIWVMGGHIKLAFPELSSYEKNNILHLISCLSDKIVCPSNFLKSQFHDDEDKVMVIPNGIDFPKQDPPVMVRLGADKKKQSPRIGMVAHLIPSKRHIDFIRAARIVKKQLPGGRFFIFGGEYPDGKSRRYAEIIREKVKDSGMEKEIIFMGFCSNMARELDRLDLLVMPFVDEGFGKSIVEAMARGKPVIAAASGGIPEIIKNGITGILVPPRNPRALAGEIIHLLASPKKANRIAQAAKISAKKLFNIDNIAKKYEKLYLSICRD